MTQMTMGGAGASKASGVLEEASCCSSGALAQQKKRPTLFSRPQGGELTGGDAPLGLVEEDEQAVFTAEDPGVLKRLAIPDADPVTAHPARGRKTAGTDFVYFFRQNTQTAT